GDQAVPHEVADPIAVLHARLAPWHILDVVGAADDQLEVSLEFRTDRLPVNPGTLHRHHGAAGRLQPLPHLPQLQAIGAVGADRLGGPLAGLAIALAGNHRRLMHVRAGTTFNACFHPLLLEGCNRLRRATYSDCTTRAPRCRGRQRAIPLRRRGSNSVAGTAKPPQKLSTSKRSRLQDGVVRSAPLPLTPEPAQEHFLPSRCGRTPAAGSLRV